MLICHCDGSDGEEYVHDDDDDDDEDDDDDDDDDNDGKPHCDNLW